LHSFCFFVKFFTMESEKEEKKEKSQVFQVHCPVCNTVLWIDPVTNEVIKFEREKKKKGSLDELLLKEKKKKEEVDRRFEATTELERERFRKAQEKFKKALTEIDKENSS